MVFTRLFLLTLVLMGSCSGGSGNDQNGDIIDRSGLTVGTITAFGSVIVNGVAYETTSAIITVNDQAAQQSDLAVGQVVVVQGTVDAGGTTGVAESISVDPYLRGPVSALDVLAGTFTVLSVEVDVVGSTLFGANIIPADVATLMEGDSVAVYGYVSSNGALVATLIERTINTELEVRGRATNVDAAARTFELGNLIVDFGDALLEGFSGEIANGDLVEAEGAMPSSGVLVADRVELELVTVFSSTDENVEIELEGIVTRFVSVTDFQVDTIQITTDSATSYEGGSETDLGLDVRVEVEGIIDANGVLVADEISFETEGNLEAEGPVESVDQANQSVTVLGLELLVVAHTQLIDESDTQLQFFSLDDVNVGDFVKIKAFTDITSSTLTLLKRKKPEDAVKLAGLVSSIDRPRLFIGSAQIDTDAVTAYEIADVGVSADEFFAALVVGDEVSAQGQTPSDGLLLAENLSIE